MRLAAILAIAATPAIAQNERTWPDMFGSKPAFVRMHEPTKDGASATITFQNEITHSQDEMFPLTFDGMTVTVVLDYQFEGSHAEAITVIVPPGYIAIPDLLVVDEGQTGEVHVFKWLGG